METVVEKFLKYIKFDTKSSEESSTTPSTKGQIKLAKELAKELKEMGLSEVSVDDKAYVMATLPSNMDKKVPTIGFISHMDTSPEISGKDIKPKFVENYDGKDIVLNSEKNIVLKVKDFPEIKDYIGKTLITTDGTTLLGADDKAGVAEIITAIEYLIENPQIKHGTIKVAFTPDEEIGAGADYFDVKKFNADFAYTVDGGAIGELEYENFNAAGVKITINGRNVHPGSAKHKMINSMIIGSQLVSMLPKNEVPEYTDGYEGFYHLVAFKGSVEETKIQYIIRDFNREKFEDRKTTMKNVVKKLNNKYGEDTVILEMNDQYYNMKEKIEPVKHIVDNAFNAMKEVGVVPKVVPIRGGTDGARLSFMGLPTPNLFTGGHNFHGRFEFIPVFAMNKAVEVILKIIDIYSK
ncbi:peptidase T [Clostridium botulinum]|uniref:peptidase T n=1 Tax=Clostridium botulinum TaxID=1491 RepID=UPI0004D94541|nr:peptidase T [Clostridium botulinum]KEI06780.1 peptidase T [Clostridium botulinum C/D str. BKT75002]KEI10890.1 peptidase T [Clostridium botulinum C/D str. BKT2873]KGM93479.1 peptidase T [Clostridium botulinum D str. CCUG 7971]KOC49190.1 peptidase T [Clostridium botulinum]MCD3350708.1 peptidase T [Clostridium botulinum D/C]